MLVKHPVKLGKAVKTAGLGNFGDGGLGADEQGLHIADAGHLNVLGHGEAGDVAELMGQIAVADVKLFCQRIQGQFLRVMGVDIPCHGIDFFLQKPVFCLVGEGIGALIEENQGEKFHELLMDDEVTHGVVLGGEEVDVVQFPKELFLQLRIEAVNGNIPVEQRQQLLIFVGQPCDIFGQIELNNQALALLAQRIFGLVQNVGRHADNIKFLQFVGDAFDEQNGAGTQQDADFIKGVEMLELHIYPGVAGVIVKKIENGIFLGVDFDPVSVLVENHIMQNHVLPPAEKAFADKIIFYNIACPFQFCNIVSKIRFEFGYKWHVAQINSYLCIDTSQHELYSAYANA